MKSWKKPTPELLAKAEAQLTQVQFYRRFFEGLKNPEWIVPLREKGWFNSPSAVEHDAERGTIGFRSWAASEYLARMAENAPEIVAETILKIPDTDNFSVHSDFIEAATKLPAALAVKIAEKEAKWVAKQPTIFTLLPEKLGALAVHLAKAGETRTALLLVEALLRVTFKPESTDRFRDRAHSKIESYHYRDFLRKFLPDLAPSLGLPLIESRAKLLHAYLCETYPKGAETGDDYSYMWRGAIEPHSQNLTTRLENSLVVACRDSAELAVKFGAVSLEQALAVFGRYKWHLFRRIELYLVRRQGGTEILNTFATKKNFFEETGVRHEYATLLRERSGDLTAKTIQTIDSWLEAGPDPSRWAQDYSEEHGKEPTPEERRIFMEKWQRRRLAYFGDKTPPALAEKYAAVLAAHAAPEHVDFPSYISSGWVGKETPKTAEEIKALTDADIIAFLHTWTPKPTQGFRQDTRSGLGQTLAEAAKSEPRRFAAIADQFIGLDPTYIRWLLHAFEEATRKDLKENLDKLLCLCEWVVAQDSLLPPPRSMDEDPNWTWVRKAAVSFVKAALEKNCFELSARTRIWAVILAVSSDTDPTPESEAEESKTTSEPEITALNTSRGQAMHAVFQYGLWVRRQNDKLPDGKAKAAKGFLEMPEVRPILESHLRPENDPSPGIRSIYGQLFPWILLLDPEWAKSAANNIFPTTKETDRLRKTAWLTYLSFCQPYDTVFEALQEQYAAGILRIGEGSESRRRHGDPDERLGNHLVTFYWRGLVTLKPESLFYKFLSAASDKLRASVIENVGRSLSNTKAAVPKKYLDRILALWDWIAETGPLAAQLGPETAASFGWWFHSDKIPLEWTLPRLVKAVERAKSIEPTQHLIAEKLTKLPASYYLEPVQIYDVLARNDKEGWNATTWEKDARVSLSRALASGDAKAKKLATELIHFLGKRGYMRFGELLAGATN